MELLLNELSIAGQFPTTLDEFRAAIRRLMKLRQIAGHFHRSVRAHRNIINLSVTAKHVLIQAVQSLPNTEKRAVMQWLTREGPFWEEAREHEYGPDESLECNGKKVTDSAVGEAGYRCIHGLSTATISLTPSEWESPKLHISWHKDGEPVVTADVPNFVAAEPLKAALSEVTPFPESWGELAEHCVQDFKNLKFALDAFVPLRPQPFHKGSAERIVALLKTLNIFAAAFNGEGKRTQEGQRIYQNHFTGDKAWFTDSSDDEKSKFSADMTFPHPDSAIKGEEIVCTWHGKVKTAQLRIHFSWPIRADRPSCVVYVGPKITKK